MEIVQSVKEKLPNATVGIKRGPANDNNAMETDGKEDDGCTWTA